MRTLVACACLTLAAATGSRSPRVSRGEVLSALAAPKGPAVDPSFECAWRGLAYEFAQQLQPFRSEAAFQDIHNGLELSALCNASS